MNTKTRNQSVDMLRGLAMLLVVLGHTMTGCTTGSTNTFLFNIIWSLQMPLFFLISGYVTRYSRGTGKTPADLGAYLLRRTLVYLLPWASWSFLVRGVLFNQTDFLNLKWLIGHMDSGYWFLATLWTITVLFGISQFLAGLITQTGIKKQICTGLIYFLFMGGLVLLGKKTGFSFFALKLTLYYMPFYFLGYLAGQYLPNLPTFPRQKNLVDGLIALSVMGWLYLLLRYHLFSLPDDGLWVLFRAATSLAGCIAVIGLTGKLLAANSSGLVLFLQQVGFYSLEIYLIHYLLLNLFKLTPFPSVNTLTGVGLIGLNFILTTILSLILCRMLHQNRVLKFILFGKQP